MVFKLPAEPMLPLPVTIDQFPEPVEEVPARFTNELLAQTLWLGPALTVGAGVKVRVMFELTALQVPLPVVVRVSVLLPAAISAADGV